MKKLLSASILGLMLFVNSSVRAEQTQNFYSLKTTDIDGKPVSMESYRGKVVMIVNTASKCGYTPQFETLTQLQKKYGPQGLQILAFPSNDFHQDAGENTAIKKFTSEKFQINFPLMEKGSVSGSNKQSIYQFLNSQRHDFPNEVLWNFEKFVLNRKGEVVERFRSPTKPDDPKVIALIEKLLKEQKL